MLKSTTRESVRSRQAAAARTPLDSIPAYAEIRREPRQAFGSQSLEPVGNDRSYRRRGLPFGAGKATPDGEFSAVIRAHPQRTQLPSVFPFPRFVRDDDRFRIIIR